MGMKGGSLLKMLLTLPLETLLEKTNGPQPEVKLEFFLLYANKEYFFSPFIFFTFFCSHMQFELEVIYKCHFFKIVFMQFLLLLLKGHDFQTGPNGGWDLGPADPLQRICREWVQKLGFDGATTCVEVGDD